MQTINEFLASFPNDELSELVDRNPQYRLRLYNFLSRRKPLSSEEIHLFSDILKTDTTIQELDISFPMSDEDFAYLMSAIAENNSLQKLFFKRLPKDNQITKDSAKMNSLTEAMKQNRSITYIHCRIGDQTNPYDPYINRNSLFTDALEQIENFVNGRGSFETSTLLKYQYLIQCFLDPNKNKINLDENTVLYMRHLDSLLTVVDWILSKRLIQQSSSKIASLLQLPFNNSRLQSIADQLMKNLNIPKPVVEPKPAERDLNEKSTYEQITSKDGDNYTESDIRDYLDKLDYHHLDQFRTSIEQELLKITPFKDKEVNAESGKKRYHLFKPAGFWAKAHRLLEGLLELSKGEIADGMGKINARFDDDGLEQIRITNVVIQNILYLQKNPEETDLDLQDEGPLLSSQVGLIVTALSPNTNIKSLNLSNCYIDYKGIEQIAALLTTNKTIQRIDLSNNSGVNFKSSGKEILDAIEDNFNIIDLKGFEETSIQPKIEAILARNKTIIPSFGS